MVAFEEQAKAGTSTENWIGTDQRATTRRLRESLDHDSSSFDAGRSKYRPMAKPARARPCERSCCETITLVCPSSAAWPW